MGNYHSSNLKKRKKAHANTEKLLIVEVGKGGVENNISFSLVFLEINKNSFCPSSFLPSFGIILHLTDSSHEIILGFVWVFFLIAVWNLCFQRRGPLGTIWDLLLKTN